jgi:hypothetical protein
MLSNASIDVAFHDKNLINNNLNTSQPLKGSGGSPRLRYGDYKWFKEINYSNYIKKYWVGLMDGDGSIQVNHWRSKNLQYRLIIKLIYNKPNYNMLLLIKNIIGGNVNIVDKNKFVIWVVNNKQDIINIIKIFDIYPLLTTNKQAQLIFLKKNLEYNDINWYFNNRNNKYLDNDNIKLNIINILNKINTSSYYKNYFEVWLSGFIEAEGCFSIRKSNNHSFSIGQNNDYYLIEFIKNYFNITNIIRKINKNKNIFYLVEVYRKDILLNIIKYSDNNIYLGYKYISYIKFKNIILNK